MFESKHQIKFCFLYALCVPLKQFYTVLFFFCTYILTVTHHIRSSVEFSTSGVISALRKFQILEHFRFQHRVLQSVVCKKYCRCKELSFNFYKSSQSRQCVFCYLIFIRVWGLLFLLLCYCFVFWC